MRDYYQTPRYYPAGYPMPFLSFFDAPSQNNMRHQYEELQDNATSPKTNAKPRQRSDLASIKVKKANNEKEENNRTDSEWPAVDIIEYETKYEVEAEVPGFQKKDISLEFESSTGVLTIQGTWSEPTVKSPDLVMVEDEEGSDTESTINNPIVSTSNSVSLVGRSRKILSERKSQRNFKRSFEIKERVDPERITASLNDGILVLELPKTKNERVHSITIS